jgi:alcohol dehydrogenase
MTAPYRFRLTTEIIYGTHASLRAGEIARNEYGMKNALVVTDKGVADSGVINKVLEPLQKEGVSTIIFDEVEANPTVSTVNKAGELFREKACDGVIAVGGGSSLDAGKSVGVMGKNPGPVDDYLGIGKVKSPASPVIAIPTTAGTAAEVTDVAVLSDYEKRIKMGLRSPHVAPVAALLDPLLTVTLPPGPTRDSGLDALCHAVESYICKNAWDASEALALRAIELIGDNLRKAVYDGENIAARDAMLKGSLLAGMAFHNTLLCLVHAITGPLGGYYNMPHGAANAILLPHCMRFMLPGAVEKYVNIAVALGEEIDGFSEREAATMAVSAIEQLSDDVGLPEGLSVYGVEEADLSEIAEKCAPGFMVPLSPRRANAEEIEQILHTAL